MNSECLKEQECVALRSAIGCLTLRAKEESMVYVCALGQFSITNKINNLPDCCRAKGMLIEYMIKKRDNIKT